MSDGRQSQNLGGYKFLLSLMIFVLEIGFEPTTNIMWTYKVTHLEWDGNQTLNLN